MSIKIAATYIGLRKDETTNDVLCYEVSYRFSETVFNNATDGTIFVEVAEVTESEANALIQQAVVDHANLQTSYFHAFTVDAVRGGRI